jgi:hypothetical protein
VVLDRGEDRLEVLDDAFLQVRERGDAAAASPSDPLVQRVEGFVVSQLEDDA